MLRRSLLFLLSTALATAAVNLTSTGCADPSGFESCQSKANQQTSACIAQANKDNSQEEILACGCVDFVNNYNCYATSCWNRVWECEYQEYIVSYFELCPTAKLPVPYFPAPDNAPDSCSCNLGKVYLAIQDAIQETGVCSNNANGPDAGANVQEIQGCDCCEISGALSSLYNICPKTDPKLIGLSSINTLETQLNTNFNDCGQYLETYDCISSLSYSLDGVSTYYKPTNLPPSGTATLSNIAGSVTSPASGSVFSYTNGGDTKVYTITAAGKVDGSSGSGNSGGSSGSTGSGGSGSGDSVTTTGSSGKGSSTGSANGSAATTTKNGSDGLGLSRGLMTAVAVFTIMMSF